MISLTTRQRDLLKHLLNTSSPVVVADIAQQTNLTSRQVTYNLPNIKTWLKQRDVCLKSTAGVGIQLSCSVAQKNALLDELTNQSGFQLVLTAEQRQQFILLRLLTADEPLILHQLQQDAQVSRTTVLKDLDAIGEWVQRFALTLQRRPNFGFQVQGSEFALRKAIVALLWGTETFGEPILELSHLDGLVFSFSGDATLLPIANYAEALFQQWPVDRAQGWVVHVENQLGGRFTDEASLYVMLVLAVQTQRAATHQIARYTDRQLAELQQHPVWDVATQLFKRMWLNIGRRAEQQEIAAIGVQLLAGSRSELFASDSQFEAEITALLNSLMDEIAVSFRLPAILQDVALRRGLAALIIPYRIRMQFGLWVPPSWETAVLSDEYRAEHALADLLVQLIAADTAVTLPESAIHNLVLLLRAAYIRNRPVSQGKVIVVCPSGMATSQLLVARLAARFPRFGEIEVRSLRQLNRDIIDSAYLIVSTTPLSNLTEGTDYIQVHPLLKPADIEKIRQHTQ